MNFAEKQTNTHIDQIKLCRFIELLYVSFCSVSVVSDRVSNEVLQNNTVSCCSSFTEGVVHSPYNEQFRQKRQHYLSIMKQFGFVQRLMETRINGEVSELIKQARLFDGKPFDPNDLLLMCVVNVITFILLGKRYEFETRY